MRTTPFHERTAALNQTHLWEHWAGFVVATKYQHMEAFEYMASRNAAAIYDTSPLFKYRISGPDATDFLAGVLTRDIRSCAVGEGHYTIWCNDAGHVLEDGVVLRVEEHEYLLTAADPNLDYLTRLATRRDVAIDDISDDFGIVAVQGPHAAAILRSVTDAVDELPYFGVTRTIIDDTPVVLSRTGFTGDLGYEIWIPADAALSAWDAIVAAGAGHSLTPMGMRGLGMARLDAGMLLIRADFEPARHAWNDAYRETPDELGLGWMVKLTDDRPFVGRRAIEAERSSASTRWKTVGFRVDTAGYEALYNDEGLIAPKEGVYSEAAHSIYDRDFNADGDADYIGYATSFGFSPILKRHIGLAKMPVDRATPGSTGYLELVVAHRPKYVPIEVVRTPLWNPGRKTAKEPT